MSDILIAKNVIDQAIENGYSVATSEDYHETAHPFRPVKCLQSDIDNRIQPTNGYVYFTLDTQKIFYGTGTEFLPMGGSSGIYYANKTFGEDAGDDMTFSIDNFESGSLPTNINDLIINVGGNEVRNGFYQVIEIFADENFVNTRYLPVGGGGGGGATGPAVVGEIKIGYISPQSESVLVGEPCIISFNVEITDANGDLVPSGGTSTWTINNKRYTGKAIVNGYNEFDVGPYLSSAVDTNAIKLTVSADTGGTINNVATKQWSVVAINLSQEWNWNYSPNSYISGDTFTLFWTPRGNVDATTNIWFGDNLLDVTSINIPARRMGTQQSYTFNSLSYGVHDVHMQLIATINDDVRQTSIITNKLTFTSGGTSPLLTVPFSQTSATQYDTIEIPFLVYDPNSVNTDVEFLVNDNVASTENYNRDLQSISYTVGVSGTLKLGLRVKGTSVVWETTIAVTPLDLDVDEVPGYAFKLKASDYVGNDGLKALAESGAITFSDNFDWVNGGLKTEVDENGYLRKYICIKNHTSMTINYNLFGRNAIQDGKNFKIIFKAANCYDYDAQVLSCYTRECGLQIKAQDATFTSSNTSDLITQYYENSYIELELDIWKKDESYTHQPDNFIMYWVDGVPANVKDYLSSVNQIQQITPQPITIGSDDCDVYIYLVKIYEKYLTEEEHLSNFIVDAPNTEEMLARFNRNDILDNNGDISYNKLIQQNPGCNAFLYRIDRMTTSKDDKVGGCDFQQYFTNSTVPDYTASDVQIRVQGTSSAAYGVAAYNIDSDFKSGLTDKDDNHHDGWAMRDSSIPISYACTKVNVASCENANNALNQEWYNEYQPYWDAHRRKIRANGKIARDCMDFIPGVMFIRDDNNVISAENNNQKNIFWDDDKYMALDPEDRPYRQYAICNMGNSKKNIEVFHSALSDLPKTCCVEVLDNQNDEHKMKVVVDESAFDEWVDEEGKTQDPFYEFRYPDEDDFDYSSMKTNFIRLVNWMATNNPAAATNEPLPVAETYGDYTFKGFTPPGYNTPSPSGVSLAGTKITTYSGTYTTDSYNRRMAKMLKECEDYLVMDSVVYHYLFIERHTMVDNVAKNTFWSTEDGLHWDLTKNYDNDTADGNDNSGNLDFYYGLEVGDITDEGEQVFNAPGAVWLEFVKGLKDAREALYKLLYSKGAWNAPTYLKAFKDFQSVVPERCWIYDYFRKYIRPRRLGLDENTYLNRLEGGKKTHQRTQFETYQDIYQNSKYKTGFSDTYIDLRLAAGELKPTDIVTISYYIDCYSYAKIGGRDHHERNKRGVIHEIPVGLMIASADDATCYFYYENMVQSLGNLASLYPVYLNGGNAIRLRSIEIGSDEEGYLNERLETLGFSSNTMLEKIYAQNVGKEEALNALSLENLSALNEIKINGSGFKGVSFANAGLLKTAYINDIITLSMSNLDKLETVSFEYDRNNYGKYKLTEINVNNCPTVNTYDLVMNSDISLYCLTKVNWLINDINGLTISNNTLTGIKILDHLLRTNEQGQSLCIPISGYTTQTALTGDLKIDVSGFNIDEYFIYEKYHKIFPNLNITYGSNISEDNFMEAKRITFYETDENNSDVLFEALISPINNTLNLATLTSSEGPSGQDMGVPIKNSTVYNTYYWNRTEEDKDWNTFIDGVSTDLTHEEMLQLVPQDNMSFTPIFTTEPRKYQVVLKDFDDTEIEHEYSDGIAYGTTISLPNYLYRENDNAMMRWAFQGWISPTDYLSGNKNPTFLATPENNQITITSDFYAYAFYKEEDCTTVPTNLNYFKFSNLVDNGQYGVGYEISIKDEYRNVLQGKITLPAKYNGQNIITALNFRNMPLVTHVYFEGGSAYTQIADYAFACDNQNTIPTPVLQAIYLPSSIKRIGIYAFYEQTELLDANLDNLNELLIIEGNAFRSYNRNGSMKVKCSKLPSKISSIGHSAFYNCSNITITELPASLLTLSPWSFAQCPNIKITEFGTDTLPGLTKLDTSTFQQSGSSVTGEIFIKNSITEFGVNLGPFERYGSNITAVLARPISEYNNGAGITASMLGVMEIKTPDYEEVIV